MPYNSNERLEREARESLVASDLSAKMKQWRDQAPPPKDGGNGTSPLKVLLVLLVLGGGAWLIWPEKEGETPSIQEQPSELRAPAQAPAQQPTQAEQEPIAKKPTQTSNRYLALAQSNYHAPDFASEIRGDGSAQDLLNNARRALIEQRFADALDGLQNIPTEYSTDAAYLRGHALFGQKKYPQAVVVFGQLTGSIRYGEAAQWYELLSLLSDFEQNKSLILKKLKRMSGDEGHMFQQEAETLQKQL